MIQSSIQTKDLINRRSVYCTIEPFCIPLAEMMDTCVFDDKTGTLTNV